MHPHRYYSLGLDDECDVAGEHIGTAKSLQVIDAKPAGLKRRDTLKDKAGFSNALAHKHCCLARGLFRAKGAYPPGSLLVFIRNEPTRGHYYELPPVAAIAHCGLRAK